MDTSAAVEKVREKLESSFGKAMAVMIMASASNTTGTSTFGMSGEQYAQFVEWSAGTSGSSTCGGPEELGMPSHNGRHSRSDYP